MSDATAEQVQAVEDVRRMMDRVYEFYLGGPALEEGVADE